MARRQAVKEWELHPDLRPLNEWLPGAQVVVCGGDVFTADRLGRCARCGEQVGYSLMLEEVPIKICVACAEMENN